MTPKARGQRGSKIGHHLCMILNIFYDSMQCNLTIVGQNLTGMNYLQFFDHNASS